MNLDVWRRLLDVLTKFEFDISQPVEKSPKDLKKSNMKASNYLNMQNFGQARGPLSRLGMLRCTVIVLFT